MPRRRLPSPHVAGLLVIALLAGCSGAASPTATPSPAATLTLAPTAPPTPQPTPDPDSELIGACYGKPVKWAAPYAGKLHPLVIAGPWGIPDAWDWLPDFDVSEKWRTGEWTGPMIQLILCPYDVKPKPSGSCGTYTRDDGVRGELIRLRDVLKVRVVVARTGKTLQTATLLGPNATCPASKGVAMDEPPPWGIRGDDVTFDQMEEYAAKVLKQPVK